MGRKWLKMSNSKTTKTIDKCMVKRYNLKRKLVKSAFKC